MQSRALDLLWFRLVRIVQTLALISLSAVLTRSTWSFPVTLSVSRHQMKLFDSDDDEL